MTIQEFSDQFDVLYNNITSNQAPGINEYEKSVFLTKAQSQLVKEYFNNRVDAVGGGFDGSQKRQYDFSCLIRTEALFNVNTYADRIDDTEKIDKRSEVFLFPENYFLSVNEILADERWQYSVLAIDYAEYQRLMLKPYNFPVKRGAWRLISDKKNCNFWRQYVTTNDEYGDEVDTQTDYVFMSSWADQKRNLEITITETENSNLPTATEVTYPSVTEAGFYFIYDGVRCLLNTSTGWSGDNLTYEITINLSSASELEDEEVIEALKEAFKVYAGLVTDISTDTSTLAKVCRHTDGFAMCSAPSKFENFMSGYTFTTSVIQVPMVEIIGKFKGDLQYQLRYVRTLKPIILEKLDNYGDDLSINGYTNAIECELPAETHEEILERAVTLAKIAWQGGTATQAQASARNNQQ